MRDEGKAGKWQEKRWQNEMKGKRHLIKRKKGEEKAE